MDDQKLAALHSDLSSRQKKRGRRGGLGKGTYHGSHSIDVTKLAGYKERMRILGHKVKDDDKTSGNKSHNKAEDDEQTVTKKKKYPLIDFVEEGKGDSHSDSEDDSDNEDNVNLAPSEFALHSRKVFNEDDDNDSDNDQKKQKQDKKTKKQKNKDKKKKKKKKKEKRVKRKRDNEESDDDEKDASADELERKKKKKKKSKHDKKKQKEETKQLKKEFKRCHKATQDLIRDFLAKLQESINTYPALTENPAYKKRLRKLCKQSTRALEIQ
eukprot:g3564.t1